jgi:hypothetical protein
MATGCPSEQSAATRQATLEIRYDTATTPKVGEELQLHLKFAGHASQQMVGALISKKPAPTTWFSEPEGAVTIDADTSKLTFNTAGSVKVWATFENARGELLTSNVVELVVARGDEAAPAEPKGK